MWVPFAMDCSYQRAKTAAAEAEAYVEQPRRASVIAMESRDRHAKPAAGEHKVLPWHGNAGSRHIPKAQKRGSRNIRRLRAIVKVTMASGGFGTGQDDGAEAGAALAIADAVRPAASDSGSEEGTGQEASASELALVLGGRDQLQLAGEEDGGERRPKSRVRVVAPATAPGVPSAEVQMCLRALRVGLHVFLQRGEDLTFLGAPYERYIIRLESRTASWAVARRFIEFSGLNAAITRLMNANSALPSLALSRIDAATNFEQACPVWLPRNRCLPVGSDTTAEEARGQLEAWLKAVVMSFVPPLGDSEPDDPANGIRLLVAEFLAHDRTVERLDTEDSALHHVVPLRREARAQSATQKARMSPTKKLEIPDFVDPSRYHVPSSGSTPRGERWK